MREKRQVIFDLLSEIHDICQENDIEYFLDGKLAAAAVYYDELPAGTRNGRILMRAPELKKFIEAFNKDPKKDRSIEYMGNSPFFSGFYLNYCDETTTHYNRRKLATEEHLGMEITINVIRPRRSNQKMLMALEQAWTNLAYGSNCSGAKLEPWFRKKLEKKIAKKGRQAAAEELFEHLIKKHSASEGNGYWVRRNPGVTRGFSKEYFAERCQETLSGKEFWVPLELENNYNRAKFRKASEVESPNTQHDFYDTDMPYAELHLDDFRESMRDIVRRLRNQSKYERAIKKEKLSTVDTLFRSYWRYVYGLKFEGRIEEIVEMHENGRYDELDELMLPYIGVLMKYRNIYLCPEINRILEERYSVNLEKVFNEVPEKYRKGIVVYDYKGNKLRTIMGDTDGRSTKFTV
ncbi:MAG: hypothetical protein MJ161_01275 [Clostridia bacterium]|nr:hypothetical protein [Clostridia bacterium]